MVRQQVEMWEPPETGCSSSSHHITSHIAQVRGLYALSAAGNGQLGPVIIIAQTSDLPRFPVLWERADGISHHHHVNLTLATGKEIFECLCELFFSVLFFFENQSRFELETFWLRGSFCLLS